MSKSERTPEQWDQQFWDIVMYEPAHDERMLAVSRYILLGQPSQFASDNGLDYSGLKWAIKHTYDISDTEFDFAFSSAERVIEEELFNGQA